MSDEGTPIRHNDGFTAEDREMIRGAAAKMDTVYKLVTGESEPERGIVVRLDRLEQSHAQAGWWFKTAVGGVVGSLGLALYNLLHHGKSP